jgi:uncharacterized membrane protein (UPF0127 family)
MRIIIKLLLLTMVVALIWLGGDTSPPQFTTGKVTIKTSAYSYPYDVELALTPRQQQYGLKHRQQLEKDRGMLFIFSGEHEITMWMQDTKLPLDMIFIDAAGKIVHIAANTEPYSKTVISSIKPAHGVLEVIAGTAAEKHIKVGDRIISEYFKP